MKSRELSAVTAKDYFDLQLQTGVGWKKLRKANPPAQTDSKASLIAK